MCWLSQAREVKDEKIEDEEMVMEFTEWVFALRHFNSSELYHNITSY